MTKPIARDSIYHRYRLSNYARTDYQDYADSELRAIEANAVDIRHENDDGKID